MLFAASACGGTQGSRAAAPQSAGALESADRAAGEAIFKANCSVCHGATGLTGGVLGPSLRHESERMDFAQTVSWIEDPQPPMPHLYPSVLTSAQVRDVAAYVHSL